MIDPVSSLEGGARFVGDIFSGHAFVTICRGTFSKALGFADLGSSLLPLALAIPVIVALRRHAAEETGALAVHTWLNIFYLGVKELRSLGRDTLMLVLILFSFTGLYT